MEKLSTYFPQTEKILGATFFEELESNYLSEDLSTFPQYLKENIPDLETRYSFISELARLEYTIYKCQTKYKKFRPKKDTVRPLHLIENAQNLDISLNPNIRLFKSRFPVWEIWQESRSSEEAPNLINFHLQPKIKNPYYYILAQDEEDIKAYSIKKKIYGLVEGIQKGDSFGAITDKLYAHKGPMDLAKAISKIHSLSLIDNYRVDGR